MFSESQLQCSICNETYALPSVINCGHTYCDECIEGWKAKNASGSPATCPICRGDIILTHPNTVLEQFIEKFVDNFFPQDAKNLRVEFVKERKKKKEDREKLAPPVNHSSNRRRILDLESEDDSVSISDSEFGDFRLLGRFSPSPLPSASSVTW